MTWIINAQDAGLNQNSIKDPQSYRHYTQVIIQKHQNTSNLIFETESLYTCNK